MVEHAKKRGKPKAARPDKVGFAILPSERLRAIASRAPEESALLQQLVRVATAATAQDQVRELKQAGLLIEPTAASVAPGGSTDETRAAAAALVELMLVPHPYSLHTQLKACLGSLCAARPAGTIAPRVPVVEVQLGVVVMQALAG